MPWCGRCCPPDAADAPDAAACADDAEDAAVLDLLAAAAAASVAPADARDAGAGNPRNKTALKPGHSLMDWIRLGASGAVDLTGVGGVPRDVSAEQLAAHARRDDAWLAIRGRVYNVTHYMDFHPGGPEELLRGAGRDATALFNQVHAWVNFESILQKCCVGRLRRDSQGASDELRAALRAATAARAGPPPPLAPPPPVPTSPTSPASLTAAPAPVSPPSRAPPPACLAACRLPDPATPRLDWFQQRGWLTLVWYAPGTRPAWPGARLRLRSGRALSATLLLPAAPASPSPSAAPAPRRHLRRFCFRRVLAGGVAWPPAVEASRGKLQVTFRKEEPSVWAELGAEGAEAAAAMEAQEDEEREDEAEAEEEERQAPGAHFAAARVVASHAVARGVRLLVLRHARGHALDVAGVGQHVVARARVQGVEVTRRYTPVPPYLHPDFKPGGWEPDCLCLMVKGYPNGALSHHITSLKEGDTLDISEMDSDFDPQRLSNAKKLFLLAAGTGITPMLGIVRWALHHHACDLCEVLLVCFNKTQADQMWAEQLSRVSEESSGQLQVEHVLSEGAPDWPGRRGHIDVQLMRELLSPPGQGVFVSACGPPGFVDSTRSFLEELGYPVDQCHIFEG